MQYNLENLYLSHGEKLTEIPSQNYIFYGKDSVLADFCHSYLELAPSEVIELQKKMTKRHCDHEMNFQTKDESGLYNKVVATPFHGFAPLRYEYVKELVNSTTPILKTARDLLQKIYSNKNVTAKNLGVDHLSQDDQNELISIIKENIYYEPAYTHKNLNDYPFLSVVGFDSAIENLSSPQNTFFEFNAGTPCGIEDQDQLLEHFKVIAPELWEKVKPYIPEDNSHDLLRETIEDCALNWTNQKDGISIIISPGPYNPAHPEIAALAKKSGMPLVKMQDLYIDQSGFLKLKINDGSHPKVTGIYNRKEESFLTYSQRNQIPLRSPFSAINKKLNSEQGLELKDGILYSYQYDANSNIIGVDLDGDGHPLFQILFDSLSNAPDGNFYGDIIDAVWNKKLYISNLGGRVLDDKRAFRILSKYQDKNSAHPPEEIKKTELRSKIKQAVIKAPDLSGGSGVYIGMQLNEEEQKEILLKHELRPDYYEVQKFQKLAVIPSYNSNQELIPLPVDWRLITFFSADGTTSFSTNSCLVRTAPFGEIKTNTSAGGGYALALMYTEKSPHKINKKETPNSFIGESRVEQKNKVMSSFKQILEGNPPENVDHFIYEVRDVLDLLPYEAIPILHHLREFHLKKSNFERLQQKVRDLILS